MGGKGKQTLRLSKHRKHSESGANVDSAPIVKKLGCHCPNGCILGTKIVDDYSEDDVVHVECSNAKCTQASVVHAQCFDEWEKEMISVCQKNRTTRHWSDRWMKYHLWHESGGWRLIQSACDCPCGGKTRKSVEYYQIEKMKEEPPAPPPPVVKKESVKPEQTVLQNCRKVQKCAKLASERTKSKLCSLSENRASTETIDHSKPKFPVGMDTPNKKKKRRARVSSNVDGDMPVDISQDTEQIEENEDSITNEFQLNETVVDVEAQEKCVKILRKPYPLPDGHTAMMPSAAASQHPCSSSHGRILSEYVSIDIGNSASLSRYKNAHFDLHLFMSKLT